MRPFFFRKPSQVNREVRRSDPRWERRRPLTVRPKQTVVQKVLAWLRGEGYDPTVLPRAVRKRARAKARAAFRAKCERRCLRPQGCGVPRWEWDRA